MARCTSSSLAVLITFALFLAVARAQACNSTVTCVNEGGSCSTTGLAAGTTPVCVAGSTCQNGICTRQPRFGETCSDTGLPCYDSEFTGVACVTGLCRFNQIYLPGESCQYNNADYGNAGCVIGSCNQADNKCTFIGVNGNCTGTPDLCGPNLYCNNAGACVARQVAGSSCSGNSECDATLICTSRGASAQPTCQSPFVQNTNQGCDSIYDCSADLTCVNKVCTAIPAAPSGNCANDAVDCGTIATCVCDTEERNNALVEQGTGFCEAITGLTSDYIRQAQRFQECAKSNGCQDIWRIFDISNSIIDLPTGPNQCTADCDSDLLFNTDRVREGKCFSSAATLVPAIGLLITMIAFLF